MKRFIIGLTALTSLSAFANCDQGTIECQLGKYIGEIPTGTYEKGDVCQLEISKKGNGANDIKFKYTFVEPTLNSKGIKGTRTKIIEGKVSSETQTLNNYSAKKERFNDSAYAQRLVLETSDPRGSKNRLYKLDITLDNNLQLNGLDFTWKKHSPLLAALTASPDSYLSYLESCVDMVKVK